MMSTDTKKKSLMKKIIIPLLVVTIMNGVIFYGTLAITNSFYKFYKNTENLLVASSSRRALYLETEMKLRWNDISAVTDSAQISIQKIIEENNVSAAEFLKSDEYTSDFLSDISDDMLSMLRANYASGIFVVLADSTEMPDVNTATSFRSVIFLDGNLDYNPTDYSDCLMMIGPSEISEIHSVPRDTSWSEKYEYIPGKTTLDFFFTPVRTAYTCGITNPNTLSYWSRAFSVGNDNINNDNINNDMPIISYSEPIIYNDIVIGVAGIAFPIDKITQLLPSNEASRDDNGCYALLSHEDGNDYFTVNAVTETKNGFEQYTGKNIVITNKKNSLLNTIDDVDVNNSQAHCAISYINLYEQDSPYSAEKWAVATIAGEDDIYKVTREAAVMLSSALVISLILGIVVAYFIARHIVKPILGLADNVRKCDKNGVIDIINTNISEINELSVMLNELSVNRAEYQNQLITERERYFLALQSINENILEYDCINDIFYMYYFRQSKGTGKTTTKKYPNFRSLVMSGRVCHEDYIPAVLDFMNGVADEKGIYLRIRSPRDAGGYIWTLAKSRNVYDSDGNLIRVIASANDVTERKRREQELLELKRRDPVTNFYKNEYGETLIAKFASDIGNKPLLTSIVRIKDMDKLLNMHGQTFCTAILEEAAIVLKRNVPENYVIFRGGMDEFVLITDIDEQAKARALLHKIIDDISQIYNGGNIRIGAVAGAYINYMNAPIENIRYKTQFAAMAAYRFNNEFDGVVFYDEVFDRQEIINEFEQNGAHYFEPFGGTQMEENSNIISFSFNIFEKITDITTAIEAVISKTGRLLDMNRVLIFEVNRDYCTIRLAQQWNTPKMIPIKFKNYISGKTSFHEIEKHFENVDYIINDSTLTENVLSDTEKASLNSSSFSIPMYDSDSLIGIAVYECRNLTKDEKFIHDLTELTKIISAYISKSKTSRESRAKSEFLSKMSHEIRTPMNAIIGMTEIAMSYEDINTPTMEYLKKIDSSSHYLLSLINDILDMSRIESGKMKIEETYLNLDELIGQIDTMMRVQTEKKGIWLRSEKNISHIHMLGDPLKLNQILVNIMGNAVKFTDKGGIYLRVTETKASTDEIVNISFSVKDTGIGISEENLERIFNSFEQANRDTMRKYGGTGLGLAISSNLVQLLGGKLEVRSALGEGSEFFFTIPMKITEPVFNESIKKTNEIDFSSKRVLIVEDDELNIEIARTLIEAEGIMTDIAENGKLAAEKFEASETGYYDAILMDIRMPVMGGIEATKLIRSSEKADASSIPIIAMTANAFDDDMKKSVECGMNGHLTKPIDMKKVMETFRRIWSK